MAEDPGLHLVDRPVEGHGGFDAAAVVVHGFGADVAGLVPFESDDGGGQSDGGEVARG